MTTPLASLIFSLAVVGSISADTLTLEGHVGGDVQIRCSHISADDNVKYFCKASCMTESDILVKSARRGEPNIDGRYLLFDEGSGVFMVTIFNLKKSDSGTYWCGVDRVHKQSLHEVILTILEGEKIPESDSGILHLTKSPVGQDSSYSTDEPNGIMFCIK
ncbi:hypothetical protein SRHO_G00178540 [Serrasalmus rhombeus]